MKQKITFVLSLLFGLFFINAGLNKFFNYMPMPEKMPEEMMKAMGGIMAIGWLMPLIAVAEIGSGLLIIFPKTRALGAIIVFPVMVGIVLTNTVTDTSGLPMTLPFVAILLWIIYDNRAKYMPMINE
ncbi:DoxX family protein [Pedobacter frigiditerrae]|uniref:DoxX family protein n=1 Tax=Pedobacter frigiditerrae TaxID=2530452 RepID=UPI00292F066A|nr:DoxX family protein [Pedobacter frigiditerrae]